MTIFKRIFGFAFVCCLCLALTACNSTSSRISSNLQSNLNRLSMLVEQIEETSESDLVSELTSDSQTIPQSNSENAVLPISQKDESVFDMEIQGVSENVRDICANIQASKDLIRSQVSSLRELQYKLGSGTETLNETQFHVCKDILSALNESCNKLSLSRSEVKNAARVLRKALQQEQGNESLKAKYVTLVVSLKTRHCNYQNTSNLLDSLISTLAPNGIENLTNQPNQPIIPEKTSNNTNNIYMPQKSSSKNVENTYQQNRTFSRAQTNQESRQKNNLTGFKRLPSKLPSEWQRIRQRNHTNYKEPLYQEPTTIFQPAVQPENRSIPRTNYQPPKNQPYETARHKTFTQSGIETSNSPIAILPSYEAQSNNLTPYAYNRKETNTIVDFNNFDHVNGNQTIESSLSLPSQNKMKEQTNLELEHVTETLKPAQEKTMYYAFSDENIAG